MLLLQLSWFGTLSEACFEASLFAEHPDVSKPLLLSACMYACMHMLLLQLSWFGTLSEACFEAPLPSKHPDVSRHFLFSARFSCTVAATVLVWHHD